jgi:hypothetical protein
MFLAGIMEIRNQRLYISSPIFLFRIWLASFSRVGYMKIVLDMLKTIQGHIGLD